MVIEIRIRGFYASDNAEAAPVVSIALETKNIEKVDWTKKILEIIAEIQKTMEAEELPREVMGKFRPMTVDEARAYLDKEQQRLEDSADKVHHINKGPKYAH